MQANEGETRPADPAPTYVREAERANESRPIHRRDAATRPKVPAGKAVALRTQHLLPSASCALHDSETDSMLNRQCPSAPPPQVSPGQGTLSSHQRATTLVENPSVDYQYTLPEAMP